MSELELNFISNDGRAMEYTMLPNSLDHAKSIITSMEERGCHCINASFSDKDGDEVAIYEGGKWKPVIILARSPK
jgi:hypothetical protein